MDNTFITQYFDWNSRPSWRVRWINAIFRTLGLDARCRPALATGSTTNVEQRMNLFLLLEGVLANDLPGSIVELGTDRGTTAVLLQQIIQTIAPRRELHLYDLFEDPSAQVVLDNFKRYRLPPPIIHAGWLADTLPAQLPDQIAFVHLDLGPSRSPEILEATVRHAVAAVYPRLSPGAVFALTDYCDPDAYRRDGFAFPFIIDPVGWWNLYPEVKRGCDQALAGKPEKVGTLYSGINSVGYFRKLKP